MTPTAVTIVLVIIALVLWVLAACGVPSDNRPNPWYLGWVFLVLGVVLVPLVVK